ncbi:uncharacterized protein LOC129272155 [Lytechinus pictus]|uniref:uncharacterized protein LOC129272155 n=1 Tax=Lytechinus pictus TaxID=7653 RepID=UPI0030B9C0E0
MNTSVRVLLSLLCIFTSRGRGQICNTPGWLEFENHQYHLVFTTPRTYNDAMEYCRSLGGDLPVITSNEQNAFLNTFTIEEMGNEYNYWIGLNDLDGDGIYTWINNSISGYSNFLLTPYTPNIGNCIRLRSKFAGQWEESECTNMRLHICQRPIDPRCFWHQYGQSLYRFMGDGQTFDAAETDCRSSGGRLAIIRSTELNTFLTSIVSPALSSPHCYWFGLNQSSGSDQFIWNDGTPISNPMWAPGEPSRFTGRSCGCLMSDGNNDDNHGRWDSRTCEDTLPYICERSQVPITGKWIHIPQVKNVQYYFSSFSTNYFIAREYCQQIGGQLAQLKTQTLHSRVVDEFAKIGVVRFWFGLDDLTSEGDFRWSDGTLLRTTGYSSWTSNQPNNYNGWAHCGEVWERSSGAGWNDNPCSYRREFVCEKSEVTPLHLLAMTPSPFGSTRTSPSFSCILSSHTPQSTITYAERAIRPSLTPEGYTLNVPGTDTSQTGGFTQTLPDDAKSVGVYKCSSTSTITGTSTSVDVTILSQDRHFQPSDGRLTKTVYPGDDFTLSVSTTDRYSSGSSDEIRWSTFSNLAEGSLSPEGDGTLTYTIRSAAKRNADIYGTFRSNTVDNRLYSLIRVIVSDCPRSRWNVPLCDRLCDNCYNGGICHPQSGTCICPPGFSGKNCLTACGKHRFGWDCELECGAGDVLDACSGSQICLPDPYGCNCLSGYTGIYCDEQCTPGKFGVDCLQDCHCAGGIPCDAFTGGCQGSCEDGWSGDGCQVPSVCPTGYTGFNCTEFCTCPDHSECEKESGFCTSTQGQCEIGYVAQSPDTPDRCSTFSGCFESCSKTCHCAGGYTDCDQETGMCNVSSCHPRWIGDNCQKDRFTVTREKTNPGVAIFSCSFTSDSLDSTLVIWASIGDISRNSLVNGQEAQTTADGEQPSIQSNFTLFYEGIDTQPIYCFVGYATSYGGFAYARVSPSGTFVLPMIRNQPRIAELGFKNVVIAWDSWNPDVDVGDGPIIGYKVYVATPDGNETSTFLTASGVPSSPPGSAPSRKRRGYGGSMKSSYEVFTTVKKERDGLQMKQLQVNRLPNDSSRKKRQGDLDILMYNISGLDDGQSYEIRISAVREGLNGEGGKGPALNFTTLEIIEEPPSGSSTGPAVGGSIGGIIILLLIAGLVIIITKRRRNRPEEVSKPVTYKNEGFIEGISTDLPTTRLDEGHKPTRIAEEESLKDRRVIPVSKFATFVDSNKGACQKSMHRSIPSLLHPGFRFGFPAQRSLLFKGTAAIKGPLMPPFFCSSFLQVLISVEKPENLF